ncbi:MAG: peptidase dimerization domain-containing protein [Bdellovibrionota bacterium]
MRNLILFLGLFLTINAQAAISDWWEKCKTAQTDCEFSAFKDIAPIYRPSREENLFIDYIQDVFARAKTDIWHNDPGFTIAKDATGSLLIQVPPTGAFKNHTAPVVAIQAHMDMILAKKGAKPGEDLRPYFRATNLEFEEVQGWFQSKDNDRSIGADNSTGVAIALRYLIDQSRAHPALEIIFTTQEEAGLVGAANFSFPLKAKRLISLDNMSSKFVTVGCQGASMDLITGEVARVHAVAAAKYYRVSIANLASGHSGAMIHRPRANAIKLLAKVLRNLANEKTDLELGELQAGNTAVLNVIPGAASGIFASASSIDAEKIKESIRHELSNFSDEDPKTAQIDAQEISVGDLHVLPHEASLRLLDQIALMPHGVVVSDPFFLNGVKTSTNFSAVSWTAGEGESGNISFGFMGRSFDSTELNSVTEQSSATLTSQWPDLLNGFHKSVAKIDPWIAPKDSQLLQLALADPQFTGTYLVPAYVEATVFAKKYPGVDIIGIGPDVADFHTFKERVRINSLTEISASLARLLAL